MQAVTQTVVMLAEISGAELILILALCLILIMARKGFRQGSSDFFKETRRLRDAADQEASDAGKSLGGIYGKPAGEALTPDNEVAELYEPDAFQSETQSPKRGKGILDAVRHFWLGLSCFIRAMFCVNHKP